MAGESIDVLERDDEAPDFELPGTDGKSYSLDDFDEYDALLVVFTCNHCPYAQAKEPILNDIASEYDEVAVVGINPNDAEQYQEDSFERMKEAIEEGRIRYDAYLFDESQTVAADYGAVCTPDPFLFRIDGSFRLAYHGRLDDALNPDDDPTHVEIRDAIDAVLKGDTYDVGFKPSRGCTIKWKPGNEPTYWNQV